MMEATRALQKASLKTQIYNKQARRLKYITGSMNFVTRIGTFVSFAAFLRLDLEEMLGILKIIDYLLWC